MKTAAVAELKAELSRYLSRVKAGEEVLVTERGAIIARIVPAGPVGKDEQRWKDLERQGLMRLGSGKLPRDFWKLPRGRDASARVRASGPSPPWAGSGPRCCRAKASEHAPNACSRSTRSGRRTPSSWPRPSCGRAVRPASMPSCLSTNGCAMRHVAKGSSCCRRDRRRLLLDRPRRAVLPRAPDRCGSTNTKRKPSSPATAHRS